MSTQRPLYYTVHYNLIWDTILLVDESKMDKLYSKLTINLQFLYQDILYACNAAV